jgi:hypothetical protein
MYGVGFGYGAIGATTKRSGGGGAYDSDAQAFFTANSTLTDLTQKNAINQLVLDLKSNSLWTKAYSVQFLFLGNSTKNSINLISPSLYTHAYTSGYTFNSSSAIPNGTSAYIDTNLNSQTVLDLNNNSIGIYSQVNNTDSAVDVGVSNTSIHLDIELFFGGLYASNNNAYPGPVTTRTDGFFLNNRISSAQYKIFRNGMLLNTYNVNSVSELNFNHYLNCRNNNGLASFFSNRPLSLFWAGQGLSDTEASNLNTCVNTLMTTLGINV